jgi:hypothetical protein
MKYYCDNQRHLVCVPYSRKNLYIMAKNLGISECWFHKNHFDIPKRRVEEISKQCEIISPRDILNIIKGIRLN